MRGLGDEGRGFEERGGLISWGRYRILIGGSFN